MEIIFFVLFLLFAVFGALVINGFYNVTRGWWKVNPDGSKEKAGQLCGWWYWYWFKEKEEPKRWCYKGDELLKILNTWQNTAHRFTIDAYFDDFIIVTSLPDTHAIKSLALSMGIEVVITPSATSVVVMFYKIEPDYVFPEWARKMMAGCITCHSSWLGSLVYLAGVALFPDAINSTALLLATWVAYCLSLAYLLPFFHTKAK